MLQLTWFQHILSHDSTQKVLPKLFLVDKLRWSLVQIIILRLLVGLGRLNSKVKRLPLSSDLKF